MRILNVQQPDTGPALIRVFNEFFMTIARFHFTPESRHFAMQFWRMLGDVVKGNDTSGPHQRRIQLKIPLYSGVGMISVNEQKIQRSAAQFSSYPCMCALAVGICLEKMQVLAIALKGMVKDFSGRMVAAAKATEVFIHADNSCCWPRQAANQEKRAAVEGAYFHGVVGPELRHRLSKAKEFASYLLRSDGSGEAEIHEFFGLHIPEPPNA